MDNGGHRHDKASTAANSWTKAWVPGQVVWAYRGPGKGWWPAVVSLASPTHCLLCARLRPNSFTFFVAKVGSLKTKPSTDGVATRSTSPASAEKGHVLARLLGKAKEYTLAFPFPLASLTQYSSSAGRRQRDRTSCHLMIRGCLKVYAMALPTRHASMATAARSKARYVKRELWSPNR